MMPSTASRHAWVVLLLAWWRASLLLGRSARLALALATPVAAATTTVPLKPLAPPLVSTTPSAAAAAADPTAPHGHHADEPSWLAATRDENARFVRGGAGLSSEHARLWRRAAELFDAYQREFAATGRLTAPSARRLLEAAEHLEALAGTKFDDERMFLLYGRLNDVYAPLASQESGSAAGECCSEEETQATYCAKAAQWCVQRALCPQCLNAFATRETSPYDCWNAAVSNAITLYRRAGDDARAEATLQKLARQHPFAATRYERVDQTPKVYFPGLVARPFWDARRFDLVRRLEDAYNTDGPRRTRILAEIDALARSASTTLTPMFSPSAPLAAGPTTADAAGPWAELQLYDGRRWDEASCALAPTLVGLMRDPATLEPHREICRVPDDPLLENTCGTAVIVTLLRLTPGSRILPHCGTTNRRLIMQFALRGSDGVAFTVGGETRGYGGDGRGDSAQKVEHRRELPSLLS